jgi:hypothetical protein
MRGSIAIQALKRGIQMGDIEIARLEERTYTTGGGVVGIVMLVLGGLLMLLAMGDNSAVRGAMYAATWTGWNVIWSACIVRGCKRTYIVYRQDRDMQASR